MLQAIRERAQGWIAWVIVFLISIPFALWGIQEYLGVGSEPVIAKVNGQEITERQLNNRYQQFRAELRERLGEAYRADMFDETALRQEVLEDMIRSNLILQASADMGLRAGDAQVQAAILAVPAFQSNGRFDKAAYERALRFQGMVPAQFEEQVRGSLMTNQLSRVVSSSEFATETELEQSVRLRNQQRSFRYLVMPLSRFETDEPVSDAEIEAYYEESRDEFAIPEQVKLAYLVLDKSAAGDAVEPNEESLRTLYRSRIDRYKTEERRRARHILVELPRDADEAQEEAAREEIAAIRGRLVAGEMFDAVATEVSDDPGSSGQGGDLGFFEKGLMDPAFEQAAFALPQGELSEPVRSAFGFHLIEVTEIEPETVKPFEEVREELVRVYRSDEAEHRYFELAEQLGNLTYENPDSLIPAADALGLEVQQSDWIDRSGGGGLLSHPKVTGAAFSEDVMTQGNNSELIEIDGASGQQALVLRVTEHREASFQSLDEVKERIVDTLRKARAAEAAMAAADDMASSLRGGAEFDQLAGSEYELRDPGMVDRYAAEVPNAVLREAFALAPEVNGGVGTTSLANGDAIVVALDEVQNGQVGDLSEQERQRELRSLARAYSRTYYERMVDDIRERADVEVAKRGEE